MHHIFSIHSSVDRHLGCPHVLASHLVLLVKNLLANARDVKDTGLIPGLGRSPGGGHGNPLQYSCLENLMDTGAWWATFHRDAQSQTRLKQLTHITRLGYCEYCYYEHRGVCISLNHQFSSVAQSCLTLCDSMDCSMPGLPIHHQLLEFTQTHVHWVSDAFQPSHPLLSPSPPSFNLSQHFEP